MTFPQVNPGGWALNEVLTSAQMNTLQSQNVASVDGVNGGTYALQSDLQFDGPALFNIGTTMEFLSGSQLDMATGSSFNLVGGTMNLNSGTTSNFDGLIGVGATGEIEIESGGELKVESGGVLGVESGGLLNVELGGLIDVLLGGVITLNGSASLQVDTGSVEVQSGGDVNVNSGGDIRVLSGGQLEFFSGGILDLNSGCVVNIANVDDVNVTNQTTTFYVNTQIGDHGSADNWGMFTDGLWRQFNTPTAGFMFLPINVHDGDDLVSVRLRLRHPAGGHGALPATLPEIVVSRIDPEAGTAVVLDTVTDPSASVGAYEAAHDVLANSGSLPDTSIGNPYVLSIQGEGGANSLDGLQISGVEVTIVQRSLRASSEVK